MKNLSEGISSILCIILNVCIISPLLLWCASVGSFSVLSLSTYVRSLSRGISLVALF